MESNRVARIARRTNALSTAIVLAATLATAGCWQGQSAATYQQATLGATGDGVEKDSADRTVGVRGALLVSDGQHLAVVVTLVNHGQTPDALTAVRIQGTAFGDLETPIPVMPGQTTSVGQKNSQVHILGSGLSSAGSKFVDVQFVFRNGGVIDAKLLVRANEGIWADIPLTI